MEPSPIRQGFALEMKDLEHELLEMGSRAEKMVEEAVESLTHLNSALAMQVIRQDDEIDQMDLDIEGKCIRLLALQHPMASDLRIVGTAMKMTTDIERVSDLAVDIARITLKVEKEFGETGFIDLPRMANTARAMLRESLEAFVRRDMGLVEGVAAKDDEVDALYRELRGQIHEHMKQHPDDVVAASWLLLAIHHIERIADHAVNIAERVAFTVTGHITHFSSEHPS